MNKFFITIALLLFMESGADINGKTPNGWTTCNLLLLLKDHTIDLKAIRSIKDLQLLYLCQMLYLIEEIENESTILCRILSESGTNSPN